MKYDRVIQSFSFNINFAAMAIRLFDPFENLNFTPQTCFLTGENLPGEGEQVPVFPEWLMDRYSLREKKFVMMNRITSFPYELLKIPCSAVVIDTALNPLEKEIETAFIKGYKEVKDVPEHRLFQWMCKLLYGVLYNDLIIEKKNAVKKGKEFKLSPLLRKKFRKLHLMLQSLVVPMDFKGTKPWSIRVVKIGYSKDVFNYKDEPVNLNFSLGMNDFGIVACLQDNSVVGFNQQSIINKIGDKTLHPVQFEELCARFIYTNYLLKGEAHYHIEVRDEKVIVESVPLVATPETDLFAPWDDNIFAQLLADYWKPWGITRNQIYSFPNSPVSYLENDYTHEFIEPESVKLPY